MAQPSESIAMSDEKSANFLRIVSLVITTGSDLLRKILLKQIPQKKDLGKFLRDERPRLVALEKKKVLTKPQFLLVTAQNPDEEKFDIALLVILLRSICNIRAPDQGWYQVPPDHNDLSIAADLLRLKEVRNNAAHAPAACLTTKQFEDTWKGVETVLTRLATPAGIKEDVVTKQIANEKIRPLDPAAWDPFIKWYREEFQSLQASYVSQQSTLSSLEDQVSVQGELAQTTLSSVRDEMTSLKQEMKSFVTHITEKDTQVRGRAQSEDQDICASLEDIKTDMRSVKDAMELIQAQNNAVWRQDKYKSFWNHRTQDEYRSFRDKSDSDQATFVLSQYALDKVPTDKQISQIAENIGKGNEQLGLHLGITQEKIEQIKLDCTGVVNQTVQILLLWRRCNPSSATVRVLEREMLAVSIDTTRALACFK